MCDQFVGLLCDQFHYEFDTREIWPIFFLIIPNDFRSLQENGRVEMVGVERIELPLRIELPNRDYVL